MSAPLCSGAVKLDQLRRLVHRERSQQSGIDQAEDRSVRADAERHRNDGERGESGMFQKLAKAEADILQKCFHKCARFRIVRCSAGALWIQEIRHARILPGGEREAAPAYEQVAANAIATPDNPPTNAKGQADSYRLDHRNIMSGDCC